LERQNWFWGLNTPPVRGRASSADVDDRARGGWPASATCLFPALPALIAALAYLAMGTAALGAERYEERLEERALAALGRRRAAAPEGLRIRQVLVYTEDIVGPGDPYPRLLNAVHVTTRESVVRRELLFAEAEPYRVDLAEETARNLRRLPIIAVARVVPLETDAPGAVDVLVATKDLWSIRLNSSFNLVGSLLQYLRLRPTEQNLLGLDKQISGDFELRLDTLGFGAEYFDRRVFGSRLYLQQRGSLVLGRDSREVEGGSASLVLGRPFFSLATERAFEAQAGWRARRVRVFQGASVHELLATDGTLTRVPYVYDARGLSASGWEMRAWPGAFRVEVGAGAGAYSFAYEPPAGLSSAQEQLLREEALPRSEDAAWIGARLRAFSAQYRVLRDVDTFALAEDLQVGPLVSAELRLAASRPAYTELWTGARYRLLARDAVLTASAAGSIRWQIGAPESDFVNRRFAAELSLAFPPLGIGRFAARGSFEVRAADLDPVALFLGGGNGLRGLAPEALSGSRLLLGNLEFRTRPVEILTLHLGAVLFWDVGGAWGEAAAGFGAPPDVLVHTLGLGLRALFPQFDVEPVRIDLGFVLNAPSPPPFERVSASFGQVTRYRPSLLDTPFDGR
jgi:hypothetical protein